MIENRRFLLLKDITYEGHVTTPKHSVYHCAVNGPIRTFYHHADAGELNSSFTEKEMLNTEWFDMIPEFTTASQEEIKAVSDWYKSHGILECDPPVIFFRNFNYGRVSILIRERFKFHSRISDNPFEQTIRTIDNKDVKLFTAPHEAWIGEKRDIPGDPNAVFINTLDDAFEFAKGLGYKIHYQDAPIFNNK